MKFNYLVVLGTASLLVSVTFSSHAAYYSNPTSSTNSSDTIVAQNKAVAVMSGTFIAAEKPTTGMAKVVKEGGHYYLELDTAFNTSTDGPDLHVLLDGSEKPPQTYQNVNRAVNLGKLRSYNGKQRYPIPDAINPSQYKSVVIWCRMANATFGYAPLQMDRRAGIQ